MEQITTIYQLGKDSVSDISILKANTKGYKLAAAVQKKGMKGNNSAYNALYFAAALASNQGYDYVLLSPERTNSGRREPILIATRAVSIGNKLVMSGWSPASRTLLSHRTELCDGDVFAPWEFDEHRDPLNRLPKHYTDLPKHPSMCRKPKCQPEPLPLETIEAEAKPEPSLPFGPELFHIPLIDPQEVQVEVNLTEVMERVIENQVLGFIEDSLANPSSPFAIRLQSAILHIAARCLTKAAIDLTKGDLPK